jgi:hypothetical protein
VYVRFSTRRLDGEAMKLDERGIGLIQVLIAFAGAAGIGYTIMNQGDIDNKIKLKLNFDQHFESQAGYLRSEMSDILNCSASLKGKAIGTETAPTTLATTDGLFRGNLNLTNQIVRGSQIFAVRAPGSSGIYADKMQILSRPEVYFDHAVGAYVTGPLQDVLRIFFVAGSVDQNGTPKPLKLVGMGGTEMSLDIPMITKINAGTIDTCYFDSMNAVKESCQKLQDAQWNDMTKECELPKAIPTSDLVQLWSDVSGNLTINKPADVEHGEVTCQKSSKRCSRTNSDCSLPACPVNHYRGPAWQWDRRQSMWDKACMKSAKCMYMAQPAGSIVKP